jgi:pimeloyl-ACP methyl ester carboxylesterase
MESTPSDLRISLCGELRITRGGIAVALPASRKTRALLAYLLLSDRPRRRDQLCEMFWDVPDDPRAALRWSLSKIRKVLEPHGDWIVADRERVAINVPRALVDLFAIEDGLLPDSDAAVLAMESPLAGLALPDLPEFGFWLANERASAEKLLAGVLRRAAAKDGITDSRARLYLGRAEAIDPEGAYGTTVRGEGERHPSAGQTIQYCHAADGTRIAYALTGDGPPLVKAANWLGHLELDWDSLTWGRMLHALSVGHRLVRYDERGNGLSDWDVDDLSFEAMVNDLEVVVDRAGFERFPLLGLSQGAAVCIEYAYRHPDRVSRLVLIGGYAAGWEHYATEALREEREAVIALVRHGWGQNNPAYRQIFSHSFFPTATAAEIDWFNEFQRKTTSADNAERFLRTFATIDVRERLAGLRAPTLVIHSRDDQRVPLERGIELAAAIPGAAMVTLDSASHTPLGREPAYVHMMERIRAFLCE